MRRDLKVKKFRELKRQNFDLGNPEGMPLAQINVNESKSKI